MKLLATILLSLCSTLALANPYIGLDYVKGDLDIDGVDEFDLPSLTLKLGKKLNEYTAFEVRAGKGIGDDDFYDIDVEIDYYYGAYFLAGVPNETRFYPYAVLGYTKGQIEASHDYYGSEKDSESDLSYGLGASVKFTDNIEGSLEYMSYIDKDDAELSGTSLGVKFLF